MMRVVAAPVKVKALEIIDSVRWLIWQKGFDTMQQPYLVEGWQCQGCQRVWREQPDAVHCNHRRHMFTDPSTGRSSESCLICGVMRAQNSINGQTVSWYILPMEMTKGRIVNLDRSPPCPLI
ncbi:MAG: hypothetical protein ACYCOU_00530 [Sulfobacillus sp.]